jgi:hypothetical protein
MMIGRSLHISIIVIFFSSLFLFSCCKNDDKDLIPCYIRIDTIRLTVNPALALQEGSLSNNIVDAWVYVDNDLMGAFELPARFPVLKEGPHTLTVRAGIKVDGIAGSRADYPFYKSYAIDVTLVRDSVITLSPVVQYKDNTVFEWVEDFENDHSSLVKSSRSDTSVLVTSDPALVFEGNYSGIVHLDDMHTFFEALTQEAYDLPQDGSKVYLEMNFKTGIAFSAGVFANEYNQSVQQAVCILNPAQQWKKIYVDLTNAVDLYYNSALDYNVFIGALYNVTVNDPVILIDNLKLLH